MINLITRSKQICSMGRSLKIVELSITFHIWGSVYNSKWRPPWVILLKQLIYSALTRLRSPRPTPSVHRSAALPAELAGQLVVGLVPALFTTLSIFSKKVPVWPHWVLSYTFMYHCISQSVVKRDETQQTCHIFHLFITAEFISWVTGAILF